MSEKRISEHGVQLVNRDDVERGGEVIKSNIEPLAEGNRTKR